MPFWGNDVHAMVHVCEGVTAERVCAVCACARVHTFARMCGVYTLCINVCVLLKHIAKVPTMDAFLQTGIAP